MVQLYIYVYTRVPLHALRSARRTGNCGGPPKTEFGAQKARERVREGKEENVKR